jgi:hypothetical protein
VGSSADSHKGHERKVSKSVALAVFAKIKAGKSSIMAEARRLGCYHATLRKEIRAAVGSKEYAKQAIRGTRPRRRKSSKPLTKSKPASREPSPETAEQRYRREYRKRTPRVTTVPTFSHVEGEFRCGRCGGDHLKTGTDGNGGGMLWCVCGWTRAIPRVRATATVVL